MGWKTRPRTLLIPLTAVPRAPPCALHVLVQPCVARSHRLCLCPKQLLPVLSHCLAHPLCSSAALSGSHCSQSHHTLPRPQTSSDPGQLKPLPLQHRGLPADQPPKPLGTGLSQRQVLLPPEELPQGQGRPRGNSLRAQRLTVPLARYLYSTWPDRCVPTSPGAGYPTQPYPLA